MEMHPLRDSLAAQHQHYQNSSQIQEKIMIENIFTPEARAQLAEHFGWTIGPNGKFQSQPNSPTLGEPIGTEFSDEYIWFILLQVIRGSLSIRRLSNQASGLISLMGFDYHLPFMPHLEHPATAIPIYREVVEALESGRWNQKHEASKKAARNEP